MTSHVRRNWTPWIPLLAGLVFTGCSGSGDSSSGVGSSGQFGLMALSVTDGQIWQINRPIVFTFSQSYDPDSVNLNTLSIQREGGLPAVGDFAPDYTDLDPIDGMPRAVIFQPVCPTESDFSDAGFKPNGVRYQIDIPSEVTGASTVRSLRGGSPLTVGAYTLSFTTATSSVLAELFLDDVLGPPTPLLSMSADDPDENVCRIEWVDPEEGEDGEIVPHHFIQNVNGEGLGGLAPGTSPVPNNLYSDVESQVKIVLEFNQAVSPTDDNISTTRLGLQYQTLGPTADNPGGESAHWVSIPIQLELVANCTETGSTIEMIPVGILPQNREMRVVVGAQFEDLVGDRNIVPLDRFAMMSTDAQVDSVGEFTDAADEFAEPFSPADNSFEDTTAALNAPRGTWGNAETGENGLQATFAFDGTGGPGGEFDLKIRAGTEIIFDTIYTEFRGGPDFSPQYTQQAVNGRLDVRNLLIEEGGILRIQGPNPAVITASEDVIIRGHMSINGSNATSVFTLDTPTQPEVGAVGQGGGGNGGTGSYLTNQVTPRGGTGAGAFQVANQGGEGGEAGWHSSTSSAGTLRRAAGGGGGCLGHDAMHYGETTGGAPTATLCPNEWVYGLNVESGFPGASTALSSQGPYPPRGGHPGPQPFTDEGGTADDFYGTKRQAFDMPEEVLVIGELSTPWPGSGGGAGGDATRADSYPPSELIAVDQDKGAGGGGGAGALSIFALGSVTVDGEGSITAIGGHGNGGENTSGVNRVGGGSGGGSGGHLIIQAGQQIDLSTAFLGGEAGVTKPEMLFHAINARGGEGGAGLGDTGGADASGEQLNRKVDAKHPGGAADNPWEPVLPQDCQDYNTNALGSNHKYIVTSAGGDGSPGIVQLHVGNLSGAASTHDVVYPGDDITNMADLIWPTPHGLNELDWVWEDQLLPDFGRISKTQSEWIPLGAPAVHPETDIPDTLYFLFDGIDATTGEVNRTDEVVDQLSPLLEPAAPIVSAGSGEYPSFHPDLENTVRFDAHELLGDDEVYVRNPNLLSHFRLTIGADTYTVSSASYDGDFDLTEGDDFLDVTVTETIAESAEGLVTVVPRYFRITTEGVEDSLPDSTLVKLEFQATQETDGLPNGDIYPTPSTWSSDVLDWENAAHNSEFRFIRYRVTFEIAINETLDSSSPRPILDFLRFPLKF
jgi:hypothetical protein